MIATMNDLIVRTRVASPIGMLALAIQDLLERGTTDEEVDALVADYRERAGILFTVDTLEFLAKGGRIGRAKALSYDIAALSATERQCQMYTPFYALVGPFPLQISTVPEPITQKLLAWKILGWGDRDETMIWMDGRPHPPATSFCARD